MNAQARILKAHPLLSLLPRAAFNNLLSRATVSEFAKGSLIFRAGEPSEGIFLLLSGRCERFQTLSSGREKVLGILVPGDAFGERDLLFQGRNDYSVRVLTRSMLLRVDGGELRKLLAEKLKTDGPNNSAQEFLHKPIEGVSPPHLGRVVALASLSAGIPDQLIVENLARSLRSATGEAVLVVHLVSSAGMLSLKEWAQIQMALQSGFYFAQHLPRNDGGFNRMTLRITGDAQERSCIAPLLSQLGRHFRYVLLHWGSDEIPLPSLAECVVQSDVTYLLLQQNMNDLHRFDLLEREVHAQVKTESIDFRPVVHLAGGAHSREFFEKVKDLGAPAHVHGSLPNGFSRHVHYLDEGNGGFNAGIRRLAREIGRCRVGLALSAGAARGLAHVGVIQVLEENGIEVDVVAGSSMGAYVASLYAFGCDGASLEKLAREMEGRWTLWKLLDISFPPRRGFITGRTIRNHLKRTIGDAHFCDLVRPLRIVATHLDFLERVVFSRGEVAEAVHASSVIPGICIPLVLNDETYIDGGIVDPLPVDVLQEMGVEKIIAVNTFAPPEQRRCWMQREREELKRVAACRPWWRKFLGRRHMSWLECGSALDVIMQGILGAQIRTAEEACHAADVVLRPIGFDTHSYEFFNPGKYIALGRKAAEEHLQELKALVNEKGTANEPVQHSKVAQAA